MNTINKILVALDLSQIDEYVTQYASYIATTTKAEKVYFVHNIKRYEISKWFEKELEALDLEGMIEKKIAKTIAENFNAEVEYEILISDDPYTESMISYMANKYQVNLVMVGNKNTFKGTGAISGKLLRLLKCDVLSVPKEAKIPAENLLCTTDFSVKSQRGIRRAMQFQEQNGGKLACLRVYNIPAQYFPALDVKQAEKRIEGQTDKAFSKLFQKLGATDIQPIAEIAGENSIPEQIQETAEEGYDLLFMSDRGQNNFTSLLVGSTTEEIFSHYLNIPLWVVK